MNLEEKLKKLCGGGYGIAAIIVRNDEIVIHATEKWQKENKDFAESLFSSCTFVNADVPGKGILPKHIERLVLNNTDVRMQAIRRTHNVVVCHIYGESVIGAGGIRIEHLKWGFRLIDEYGYTAVTEADDEREN